MTHYRLYPLDEGDHILKAVDLNCADDDEAVRTAATYADGHAVELWQKTRRVVNLPAKPKSNE